MGVAASHLDWSMVPYVRKSFWKHYKDGYEFLLDSNAEEDVVLPDKPENVSIDDLVYKKFPRVYKYALKKTEKEAKQAVEGMYHNLNTLQSRSGNQLNLVG